MEGLCLLLGALFALSVLAHAPVITDLQPHKHTPLLALSPTAIAASEERGAVSFSLSGESADPIDELYFFGESTTAHLRNAGVLRDGRNTHQVLAPSSNTVMLTRQTADLLLVDPMGGSCTLRQFAAREKPGRFLFCFGLNGITQFSKDPARYLEEYYHLCQAVWEQSPETEILVQTVYPVARAPLHWSFSSSPAEINTALTALNAQLQQLEEMDPRITCIDLGGVLRDAEGFLPEDATTDGIHLTPAAYQKVLSALRETLLSTPLKKGESL